MKPTGLFILLLCIVFFCKTESFAQKSYQSATIYMKDGTSQKGFVEVGKWNSNPEKIKFKSNSTVNPTVYRGYEIDYFELKSGAKYRGAIIQRDRTNLDVAKLEAGDVGVWETDTTFLQVLVEGEYDLFYLKDKNKKKHFYMQEEGKEIEALEYRKYLEWKDSRNTIKENENYKAQIRPLLDGCSELIQVYKNLKYDTDQLSNAFQAINRCKSDKDPTYVQRVDKQKKIIYGAFVGGGIQNMDFLSRNHNVGTSPAFIFGGSVDILSPKSNWSASGDVYLGTSISTVNVPIEGALDLEYQYDLNYTSIGIDLTADYNYSIGSKNIYAGIGLLANRWLKAKRTQTTVIKTIGEVTVGAPYRFYGDYSFGLIGKIGIMFNDKIKVEIRTIQNSNMVVVSSNSHKPHATYITVGYLF